MSKGAVKQPKVDIEEDKAAKIGFENTPKLFSKWSYDDIKVPLITNRSKILASSITSHASPPNLKSSSLTPPDDIKPKNSEKLYAPSSKDWLDSCNSTEETLEKKLRLSESSDIPLKSSTS